jgi:hypothetical protein
VLVSGDDVVDAEEVTTGPATRNSTKAETRETPRTETPRRESENSRKHSAPVYTQPSRAPDDPGTEEDEFDDPTKVPGSLRVPG